MAFGDYEPYYGSEYDVSEASEPYAESYEESMDEQYVQSAEEFIVNALASESQNSFFGALRKLTPEERTQVSTIFSKIERKESLTEEEKGKILDFIAPLAPYFKMLLANSSYERSKSLMEGRIKSLQQRLKALQDRYQKAYGSGAPTQ